MTCKTSARSINLPSTSKVSAELKADDSGVLPLLDLTGVSERTGASFDAGTSTDKGTIGASLFGSSAGA